VSDFECRSERAALQLTGHLDDPAVEVRTVAGTLLVPSKDHVITPVLQRDAAWEAAETRFLLAALRPGQTFVDVGAHVGYFSVLAARCVGPDGAVFAVEPEARNLWLLRANLARNGCTNAVVVPSAAHSTPTWMSLALDETNRGGHRLVPYGEAETNVWCVRLDDILPARVDVVKIDAQGYDHEILDGLERTLAANPHLIVLAELSLSELARRGIAPGSVLGNYRTLGFSVSTLDPMGRVRRRSVAQVLDDCRSGVLPSDFSLVLDRPQGVIGGASRRPTAADGLEVRETADGLIVFEPSRNRVHQLNPTAAVVFDLCNGERTVTRIIELVQQVFGLSEPSTAEVVECVDHLYSEGLVS
jgi:FkbM family methyltransferase